jgi:hypothetical protein
MSHIHKQNEHKQAYISKAVSKNINTLNEFLR